MKSVKLIALAAALAAAHANAFNWPATGGTATIPAGETVTVTGNDVTTAAACGEIVIEAGAMLKISDITDNATFAGKISGAGKFSAVNAKGTKKRLTFTGDLSGFTGGMDFSYVHATFTTAQSGSFTIKFVESNDDQMREVFSGGFTYNNPLDVSVGANYGLEVASGTTVAGAIELRSGRIRGPGTVSGELRVYGTCYVENKVVIKGDVKKAGSGTCYFESDGGTTYLKAPVDAGISVCVIGMSGKFILYGENLFADSTVLNIGKTWSASHKSGTYDLNGYSQRAMRLALVDSANMQPANTVITSAEKATLTLLNQSADVNYKGQLTGAASLDLASASAKTFTLSGTANDTTGSLTVRSGTLALGASAKFPSLSGLVVTNTGTLSVSTENVNPNVELNIFGSGVVNVSAGVTLQVDRAKLDGDYLPPGDYEQGAEALGNHLAGGGTLRVLNGAPVVAGDTYVWTGAAGDGLLTTDGNWEGGEAPDLTAGTAKLFFSAGTASATVSGTAHVYGITFCTNAAFTLTAADANAKVVVGAGGFLFTNTAAASVTHVLDVPVEIGTLPQTWCVASTNTQLSLTAPLTGRESLVPLTIDCRGRVQFRADNSGLLAPLVLTNLTTVSQPYVYDMKGLGAKSRYTTCWGALPRFITDAPQGGSLTNETPLRLHSGLTNTEGAYMNSSANAKLYMAGKVAFFWTPAAGQSETYFHGEVHFIGGVTNESGRATCWRIVSNNIWIEGDGFKSSHYLIIDYGGTVHIASPSNNWSLLNPYKSTVKCHGANVLAKGQPVRMSDNNTYYHSSAAALDLNGYDQSISRIYAGWQFASWPDLYTTLKSETPAMLEIATDTAYNDIVPLKVTGAAGLKFNAAGSLTFTNFTSATTGTLEVDRGTVRIARGSGWTATTNIVLAGGTLAVDVGAGATAFGSAQDVSAALLTVVSTNSPTLSIASGERPTMEMLAVVEEGGKVKWKDPGIYGGPDAGLSASRTVDWISGTGTLRVRHGISGGTMLIIR